MVWKNTVHLWCHYISKLFTLNILFSVLLFFINLVTIYCISFRKYTFSIHFLILCVLGRSLWISLPKHSLPIEIDKTLTLTNCNKSVQEKAMENSPLSKLSCFLCVGMHYTVPQILAIYYYVIFLPTRELKLWEKQPCLLCVCFLLGHKVSYNWVSLNYAKFSWSVSTISCAIYVTWIIIIYYSCTS